MFRRPKIIVFIFLIVSIFALTGCGGYNFSETETEIISATSALDMIKSENVILVDAQTQKEYSGNGHVNGAVNIERNDIVISDPVPNMLAPASQIEKVLENSGISNNTTVVVYDNNNNMDAARLWWTLKVYGHDQVKVVSGGLNALIEAGAQLTKDVPSISTTDYKIDNKNNDMIATLDDIKAQINEPSDNVIFLDVRTTEEVEEGTIPTSVHVDYVLNNYSNGEYRKVQDIQIMYIENGIVPDDEVIMYCKTSIRAAQTYLALYNAGYRNLKLYDGAWSEYILDDSLPQQQSEETQPIQPNMQDNS